MSNSFPRNGELPTLARTFFSQAELYPKKIAIYCDEDELTFEELSRHVRRWAAGFENWGIQRGEHVGVILPNSLNFVTLMLTAAVRGIALVPLPDSLTPATMASTFAATDVSHVVATVETLRALRTAETDSTGCTKLRLAADESLLGGDLDIIGLEEFLDGVEQEPELALVGCDDDPFILTTTSGSTGDPKPIILSQRTKRCRALAAVNMYGITGADVTLAATPLHHSLAERLVLIPLLTGGTSVVMPRFSPKEWLSVARRRGVTFTIAVSSQLVLIAQGLEDGAAIDSLRCVVSSSAGMDSSTKKSLLETLHCDFHECYGTSEIAVASNLDPATARIRTETVGRAVESVDIQILDDHDRTLPPGQVGEIVCQTPMLFGGYYKKPKETAEAMWGEYFRTGDLGKLDGEGNLTFVGRKKEIIITGGINVYPADIESVLVGFSGIKEVAAFAIPNSQLGEIVGLAVVEEPGQTVDLRRMRHHCAVTLADFQQPREFIVVDNLPRNSMGKLMRRTLAENYLKGNSGERG